MTVEIQHPLAVSSATTRIQDLRAFFTRYFDVFAMMAVALIAGAYSLQYDILRQPIPHDTTYHIYAAQQILANHPIYRDVGIIKAPLSDLISAFAILLARVIGISDIMGTRMMSLSVVMATAAATYLSGRVLFRSRSVGLLAGLLMAGWNFFGIRALTGPEPKAFMILFSLLTLVFIARKHWGWAGATASLATLSWQPALMLVVIAGFMGLVAPWLDNTTAATERVRAGIKAVVRVTLGFAAPLALVILYLLVNSALMAAFNATIGANVIHFNNNQMQVPLVQTVDTNMAAMIEFGTQFCFSIAEHWLVGVGMLGFLGLLGVQVGRGVRARRLPIDLDRAPFLLYGLGFIAFTLVDFNFCPDLFVFLPVIALSAAWLAVSAARGIALLVGRVTRMPAADATQASSTPTRLAFLVIVALLAVGIVFTYLLDARGYRIAATTFLDQLEVTQAASKYVGPEDRVLAFGNALVLIELHKDNASKILHLGSKSGLGVLAFEEGGVEGMLDELKSNPPKLISLARENRLDWTIPIYEWIYNNYDIVETFPRANMRLLERKTQ